MLELSPSRLSTFRQCRRKYKFHYVDGLYKQYGRPRPYFTMGDHVHWTLKVFLSRATPPEKRTLAHLQGLLRQRWRINRIGFANRDEERDWGEKALRQLKGFFESQDISAVPWMTESVQKAPLSPGLRLMGKIDRVDKVEDGLAIFDYKTGRRPLVPNLLQLRAYAIIVQKRCHLPVVNARYLYLESGGATEIKPQAGELAEAEDELVYAGEEILGEQEFLPNPNKLCPYCDFLDICSEGIAYGGPTGSWDDLEV